MFNLLMTWQEGGYDTMAFQLERDRFAEFTDEKWKKRFGALKPGAIKKLKAITTLFVEEHLKGRAHVGYLSDIRERNAHLLLESQFDKQIESFPAEKLEPLLLRLDITNSELYRTHWAIKNEDLLKVLASAGLAEAGDGDSVGAEPITKTHFKVALSFPGESRDYISKVADILKERLPKGTVFYDSHFRAQLARPNLDILLQSIYGERSDLIVVFLSEHYEKKDWCGLEWRSIREISREKMMRRLC